MKIIHTSDIHLDSRLTSRLSPDKAKVRRRELLSNLSRFVSEARRLSASAIIIAGDLFDSERVSSRALETALDVISGADGIGFFYLPGNHEKNALTASGRTLPANLFIFGEEWTYYKAGDVVIAGRSRCCENMFDSLDFKKEDKNIAVLHGELRDRSLSPDAVGLRDAAERNIDYLALGHYHSFRSCQISGGGSAVYSGTPEGRGFDECGKCGFVLIDTDRIEEYKFIPFAKRIIHNIEIDINGLNSLGEVQSACQSAIRGLSSDDLVRLELVGQRGLELWLDEEAIADKFRGGFFHLEVKNSTRLLIKKEDYQFDKTLKGEFIRLVSSREDLDELTKEKIIEMGLNALMGEEV